LAFPISNFHQELDSNDKIQEFVTKEYPEANFPIFGLSSLEENVVYQQLQSSGNKVRWNFFKYLVDRNGKVVEFYDKRQNPSTLANDIETLLDAPAPQQHKLVTQ
jgi:glutathione peroxidase